MFVYRIAKEKYVRDLSGEGASRYPGRWNTKNSPVIYTAESLALAAWEFAIRIDPVNFPPNLAYAKIKIPDDSITSSRKISTKTEFSRRTEQLKIGAEFLSKGKHLVLQVPSVVVPDSFNYVINPRLRELQGGEGC